MGESGTATAIIEDGTNVPEAAHPRQYDSEPPQFLLLCHSSRTFDSKSMGINQSASTSFTLIPIKSNIPQYADRLTLTYPGGTVNSYIDTSSNNAYQEVQRIQLEGTTTLPDISFTRDSFMLAISQSYAGGRMQVNMTTTNGKPLDVELRLNNRSIGSTSWDGVRWLITPSENYTLTAVLGEEEIPISDIQPTAS